MSEFKTGDKVVYPAQGVAEVMAVETKDIAGTVQDYYVLKVLDTDRKIMVPVRNADAIGLRAPISEAEIKSLFKILRDQSKTLFQGETWHKRFKGYQDMVKTGDIKQVAQVLRDLLMAKSIGRQLAFSERRLLETVRQMVTQEVAISREVPEEDVEAEIEALFATAA